MPGAAGRRRRAAFAAPVLAAASRDPGFRRDREGTRGGGGPEPSLPVFPPLGRCQVTETSLDATDLDWLRGGLRTSRYQGLTLSTILQNLQNGYVSGNDRGVAQVQRSRPS
ncbi:unnamed protein product, partial [Rangifer tarandus platyrhynchus]